MTKPADTPAFPEVMNLTQAAAYLQVSRDTLRAWLRCGRIPHLAEGRLVRVCRADCDEFVRRGGQQ